MTTSTREFLDENERKRIVAAVRKAETSTSGEIVPLVAARSADYPAAVFNGALSLGLLVSIATAWALGREDMWSFLVLFCAAYALCFLLLRSCDALKRLFLPARVMDAEVARAAMTAFHAHGLHRTREMTGVLLYVSVFERRVHVLADKGINDKVAPEAWNDIVALVVRGIREGRQGEALAEAVTRCGELLSAHFPVRPDDIDELPNLIVESDER